MRNAAYESIFAALGSFEGGLAADILFASGLRLLNAEAIRATTGVLAGGATSELSAVAPYWSPATITRVEESIIYRWQEHAQGYGKSVSQYTNDAVEFFATNKGLGNPWPLRTGGTGIKIASKPGGISTNEGKIVTFWYE